MDKQRIVDYLVNTHEIHLDEEEVDVIIGLAVKLRAFEANKGFRINRIENNPREKAFHDEWLRQNEPRAGVNEGNGILQDLFIESTNSFQPYSGKTIVEMITHRDRMIVATIIQWLGSNVGMGFLHAALARVGYSVVKTDQTKPD